MEYINTDVEAIRVKRETKVKTVLMITYVFLLGMLSVSCVNTDKNDNSKNIEIQKTTLIQKANTPTPEVYKKDRNLYYEFILNLEETLWSSDLFVKTDYNGRGWQLLDKNGKYIIRSDDNYTEYRDTSVSYTLTIITIDNYLTNKNGESRTISIPYRLSDGRTSTIDLDFTYHKSNTTNMSYSEKTLNFSFNYGIIVDYRDCFNDDKGFTWRNDSIIRYDFDCRKEFGYIETTL